MSAPKKTDSRMFPPCPACGSPCSIQEASCPDCGTQTEDQRHTAAIEEIFRELAEAGYRDIAGGRG